MVSHSKVSQPSALGLKENGRLVQSRMLRYFALPSVSNPSQRRAAAHEKPEVSSLDTEFATPL